MSVTRQPPSRSWSLHGLVWTALGLAVLWTLAIAALGVATLRDLRAAHATSPAVSAVSRAAPPPETEARKQELEARLAWALTLALFVPLPLALVAFVVVRRLDAAMQSVTAVAEGYGPTSMHLRVPERGPTEFLRMAQAINRSAARLEEAVVPRDRFEGSEIALRRALREWNATFDSIEIAILVTDGVHEQIRHANRRAATLLGLEPNALCGRRLRDVASGDHWDAAAELVASIRLTGEAASTRHHSSADGRTWTIGYSPDRSTSGSLRGALWLRDDTELEKLEETARRNERMAALGHLLGGAAHEVRNPLFAITANLDAWEAVDPGMARAEFGRRIRSEVEHLTGFMRDLLEFGNEPESTSESVDLTELLEIALESTAAAATAAGVRLENLAGRELPAVRGNGLRLSQALRNLIENAVLHSPRGGKVSVRKAEQHEQDAARWVELLIEDDGTGFPAEHLDHLFEPFVTHRRGGTGLGLVIVRRAVDAAGGSVYLENRPEGGARVRLRLLRGGAA